MWVGIGVGIGRNRFATGIFGAYESRVIADGGVVEAGQCVDAVTGLLLNASLLLIPSGYKANKLYSEIPTNGNGDFTWARTSTANRTNSSGNIELMATGVPRLSYMYGSCPAVLLEPQRTNLALQSQDFDNASWTKTASSITANTTTSPDGNSNADTFIANGVSTFHIIEQSFNTTNGTNYAFSVYAKKNTNNFLQIIGGSSNFGLNAWANFDLNNGVVGSAGSSATASIVNVGNGWYRCVMVAQGTATLAGTSAFGIISSSTAGRGEINTLSTSVFLWGAQFEAGAYPTTYIPTTSATATRVSDSYSRDNIFTNSLITSSGGTWFIELRNNIVYTRDNASSALFINTGTSASLNDGFRMRVLGASRFAIDKIVAGVSTSLYTTTTDTTKLIIKWNGTSADIFANGTKVVSATAFTTTAMEYLNGTPQVPIFIQQMALFSTPLSDTDCTTLTT